MLIVGNHGFLVRDIIATAYKSGWEIYLLTGEMSNSSKPPRVFEQFLFPYDSQSVREVVESVCPDAVLFMGRFDASLPWREPVKAYAKYMAGLTSVLLGLSAFEKARLVYVSTQEVFSEGEGLSEDTPPEPDTEIGKVIAMGERMALEFAEMSRVEVTVARLERPYGVMTDDGNVYTDINDMCLSAARDGRLEYTNRSLSAIYSNDVAECVFRIVASEKPVQSIYHITGESVISEKRVAEIIASASRKTVELVEAGVPAVPRVTLSSTRAGEDFNFSARHDYEASIPLVMKGVERGLTPLPVKRVKTRTYGLSARAREIIENVLPYIENILCGAGLIWLDSLEQITFAISGIDIMFLYTLLFGGLHGKRQAILASAISIAYWLLRADNVFDMMINYDTYILFAVTFTSSLMIGHLRDINENINAEKDDEMNYLRGQLEEMVSINATNVSIKRAYEMRLIDYNGSLGRIYKVTSELNRMNPGEVLFSAAATVADIMQTKDIAIYQVANARYCRLFSSTSASARKLGKSFAYADIKELNDALTDNRVYINKKLDPSLPMMASGIYDDEQLSLIIFVWNLKIENLTLYQANLLTILCYLIMLSMNRANRYFEALASKRMVDGTRILDADAFAEMLELYRSARDKRLAEFVLLKIDGRERTTAEWDALLSKLIRQTDIIGENRDGDDSVFILLPNASATDFGVVRERLINAGVECRAIEGV